LYIIFEIHLTGHISRLTLGRDGMFGGCWTKAFTGWLLVLPPNHVKPPNDR